jgi:hypothetical protein
VTGNFSIANGAQLQLGGDTTVYVGGQLYLTRGYIVTSKNKNVLLMVDTLKLDGSSYIQAPARSAGDTTSLGILVNNTSSSNSVAYLTNSSHLDNALLLTHGDITLDSSSYITGAAVSTMGDVYMTNHTVVTYDATSVSAVLDNNPGLITGGGGGGSTTVTPSDWKNL